MELRSTQSPIDKFFVLSWGYCVSGILEIGKQTEIGWTNLALILKSAKFCLKNLLLRFLSFSLFAWCVPLALTAAVIGLDVALPKVTEK